MELAQTAAGENPHTEAPVQEVRIHVNEKPVRLVGHNHTGLQIKQAAIAQNVKIQLDFLLYLPSAEQADRGR